MPLASEMKGLVDALTTEVAGGKAEPPDQVVTGMAGREEPERPGGAGSGAEATVGSGSCNATMGEEEVVWYTDGPLDCERG